MFVRVHIGARITDYAEVEVSAAENKAKHSFSVVSMIFIGLVPENAAGSTNI
jgi:hypothetical protein